MFRSHRIGLIAAIFCASLAAPASAQNAPAAAAAAPAQQGSGTEYVVTYIDAMPDAAGKAAGILRRYSAQMRKTDNLTGFMALREHGRPGRFAMVEEWIGKSAYEAHAAAAKAFADQLQPYLAAPLDVRPSSGLDIGGLAADAAMGKGVVFVLTHVDVVPTGKDTAIGLVKQLCADARKDGGNDFFNAFQQDSRANHMTLYEAWRDRGARNAYVAAEHTKEFRGKVSPLAGALYDERLYEALR